MATKRMIDTSIKYAATSEEPKGPAGCEPELLGSLSLVCLFIWFVVSSDILSSPIFRITISCLRNFNLPDQDSETESGLPQRPVHEAVKSQEEAEVLRQ